MSAPAPPPQQHPEIGEGLRQLALAAAWRGCALYLEKSGQEKPSQDIQGLVLEPWLRCSWLPGLQQGLGKLPAEVLVDAGRLSQAVATLRAYLLNNPQLRGVRSRSEANLNAQAERVKAAVAHSFQEAENAQWQAASDPEAAAEPEVAYLTAAEMAAAWIYQAQACRAWGQLRKKIAPVGDGSDLLSQCRSLIEQIDERLGSEPSTGVGSRLWRAVSFLHSPADHLMLQEVRQVLDRCCTTLNARPPAADDALEPEHVTEVPAAWLSRQPPSWPPLWLSSLAQELDGKTKGQVGQTYLGFLKNEVVKLADDSPLRRGPEEHRDVAQGMEARLLLLRLSLAWLPSQAVQKPDLPLEEELLGWLSAANTRTPLLPPSFWATEVGYERCQRFEELLRTAGVKNREEYKQVLPVWARAVTDGETRQQVSSSVGNQARALFENLYRKAEADDSARKGNAPARALAVSLYRQLKPVFGLDLQPPLTPDLKPNVLAEVPASWGKVAVRSQAKRGTVVGVKAFGDQSGSAPTVEVSVGEKLDPRLKPWLALPALEGNSASMKSGAVLVRWHQEVWNLLDAKQEEVARRLAATMKEFKEQFGTDNGEKWFHALAAAALKEGPQRQWLAVLKEQGWCPGCYPDVDDKGKLSWPGKLPVHPGVQYEFDRDAQTALEIKPTRFATSPDRAECIIRLGGEPVRSEQGQAAKTLHDLAGQLLSYQEEHQVVLREVLLELFAFSFSPKAAGAAPHKEAYEKVRDVVDAVNALGSDPKAVRSQSMAPFLDSVLAALEKWCGGWGLQLLPSGYRYRDGNVTGEKVQVKYTHSTVENNEIVKLELGLRSLKDPSLVREAVVWRSLGKPVPNWKVLEAEAGRFPVKKLGEDFSKELNKWLLKKGASEDDFRLDAAQVYDRLWQLNAVAPQHEKEILAMHRALLAVLQYFQYEPFEVTSTEQVRELGGRPGGRWVEVEGGGAHSQGQEVQTVWPGLQTRDGNLVAAAKVRYF